MTLFAMERAKMIGLMLFLILVSCESKPTEEQLVRECQNRNGVPNFTSTRRVQVIGKLLGQLIIMAKLAKTLFKKIPVPLYSR